MSLWIVIALVCYCVFQTLLHFFVQKRKDDAIISLVRQNRDTVELALVDQHKKLDYLLNSRKRLEEAAKKARETTSQNAPPMAGMGNRLTRNTARVGK